MEETKGVALAILGIVVVVAVFGLVQKFSDVTGMARGGGQYTSIGTVDNQLEEYCWAVADSGGYDKECEDLVSIQEQRARSIAQQR